MLKPLILTISILILLTSSLVRADVIDDLVPIICMAESSNNPFASDGKSFGLMGISECVLKDFNTEFPNGNFCEKDTLQYYPELKRITDGKHYPKYYTSELLFPSVNIEVGTWYLRKIQSWLPEEYKNSKPHIISGWNNGIGWLKKHNWQPPKSSPNKIYNKIYQGER